MHVKSICMTAVAVMMISAGSAPAQNTSAPSSSPSNPATQNPTQPATSDKPDAKQSAPAESPQASGHDAQSGQPETGPNAAKTQGTASGDYKGIHDGSKK